MGGITDSFRIRFQQELGSLNQYRQVLMDPSRRDAVDSLITVWSSELGAMSYGGMSSTLDIMLLAAAVDNRKEIDALTRQVELLRSRIERLQANWKEQEVPMAETDCGNC